MNNIMLQKKRKVISLEVRSQIISESLNRKCSITNLAKTYAISASIIYKWRKKYQNLTQENLDSIITTPNAFKPKCIGDFIELSLNQPSSASTGSVLQKASLIYQDFSLSVEGKINNNVLIQILKILEESC
jgi:transposase-like protein